MPDEQVLSRLESTYGAGSIGELRRAYDNWAEEYEADVQQLGRTLPVIVAGLLARYMPPDGGAVLDAGAGTGIMGQLLSVLGYDPIDALDLSEQMLAQAKEKGVYRELHQGQLGKRLDLPDNRYSGVVAVGVLTVGHAGPEALDELIRVTRPGGVMVFNVTSPLYRNGFGEKVKELESDGRWELIEATEEFPPHLNLEGNGALSRVFAYRVL